MTPGKRKSRETARELYERFGGGQLPVDVDRIADQLDAVIRYQRFEGNVSGALIRDGKTVAIGVNVEHSLTRRRFTIAHEIGHLRLHVGRPLIVEPSVRVNLRDDLSSLATDQEEIEANAFAAELLMPKDLVESEVDAHAQGRRRDPAAWTDRDVEELAERFLVSPQAMAYRLANLGIRPLL